MNGSKRPSLGALPFDSEASMERSRNSRRHPFIWFLFAGFMVGSPVVNVSAAESARAICAQADESPKAPIEERMEFEPILTALVQDHLAREERLPGQQATVVAKVWYGEKGDAINIDLGRRYLPTHYTMTFEEHVNAIVDFLYYTKKPTEISKVNVWFDGKDIFEYFPDERGPQDRVGPGTKSTKSCAKSH